MDIQLNTTTHDIEIINGEMLIIDGVEAIRQNIKQKIKFFYGEWFLDTSLGVPYFQHILTKNPSPTVVDSMLKKAIIETPGVLELIAFTVDFDFINRILTLNFSCRVTNGVVEFNESVI